MTPEKPEECDTCGWPTKHLTFHKGRGRADGLTEDVPWIFADHWHCRLCGSTGLGFEVHQARVNHAVVQGMNVILEAIDRLGSNSARRGGAGTKRGQGRRV